MILFKKDNVLVGLRPQARLIVNVAADVVREVAGENITVTSGLRPRVSGPPSFHPFGYAVDWIFPSMLDDEIRERVLEQMRRRLGPDYDLVDEVSKPVKHATGPHLHGEYDPKS